MTIQDESALSAPAVGHTASGRWPATAVFFLNGSALSTYIVRLPSLKAAHHLTDSQLGTIGMLFALAALTSMQFVGPLVARVGSRPVLRASLVIMPLLLAFMGSVHDLVVFAIGATALGMVHGATDVAMNAHAVTVERRAGRAILNGCHAAWSISAVVASLTAAGLAYAGASYTTHLVAAGAVLLVGGLVVGPRLLPPEAEVSPETHPRRGRLGWRDGWTRPVVMVGLIGMGLMVCEGAALGWSGIFLHDSKGASFGLAATAVTAYTAGQTGGRLVGDRLTMRYRAAAVFRTGGLLATCGLTWAVLAGRPTTAVIGFAVMGLGTSVLLPLTFSAAGRIEASGAGAAASVSRFTTFTYTGILLGPSVIGWAAQVAGLTWTMAALVPVLGGIALLSRFPKLRSGAVPSREEPA